MTRRLSDNSEGVIAWRWGQFELNSEVMKILSIMFALSTKNKQSHKKWAKWFAEKQQINS